MDKLPVEVLLCIFELLHPIEKRICLLVCRRWLEIIQSNCLWHTVLLNNINAERLKVMNEKIQGDQTLQLLIENCDSDIDLNLLAPIFPHLQFLYLSYRDENNYQDELVAGLFKSWQNRLKSITGCTLISNVLNTGTFNKVTTISLNNVNFLGSQPNRYTFETFRNTPALSSLCLEYFDMVFDDYELLHKCAPLLTSLSLYQSSIKGGSIPNIVLPAMKMKSLFIQSCFFRIEEEFELIKYIIQKYVNLQRFSFENIESLNSFATEEEDYFIQFTQPLIQSLGSQITTFGLIGRPVLPQVFLSLDKNNLQLRHAEFSTSDIVSFTENLISSNQINFLTTLSITWSSYLVKLPSFKPLQKLESLKLEFQLQEVVDLVYQVKFNHLLVELCPDNLKTLELWNMDLNVDPAISNVSKRLQCLKLISIGINQDISECLSMCCPLLKKIYASFSRCQEILFHLPDLDLALFETYNADKTYLLIEMDDEVYAYDGNQNKTTQIRQNVRKHFGDHNLSVYPAYKMILSRSTAQRIIINLTCRSLSTLFIDGRLVLEEQ